MNSLNEHEAWELVFNSEIGLDLVFENCEKCVLDAYEWSLLGACHHLVCLSEMGPRTNMNCIAYVVAVCWAWYAPNVYVTRCHKYLQSLLWRHNGNVGVSNHQPHDCLLNRSFRHRSKKTSKLHVTGLCVGNSPVTGEFPAQKASDVENFPIWWRHHHVPFLSKLPYACICIWDIKNHLSGIMTLAEIALIKLLPHLLGTNELKWHLCRCVVPDKRFRHNAALTSMSYAFTRFINP